MQKNDLHAVVHLPMTPSTTVWQVKHQKADTTVDRELRLQSWGCCGAKKRLQLFYISRIKTLHYQLIVMKSMLFKSLYSPCTEHPY